MLTSGSSEQLIILASFSGSDDDVSMDGTRPRRIYAVLYISFTGSSFLIDHITGVPYQSVSVLALRASVCEIKSRHADF